MPAPPPDRIPEPSEERFPRLEVAGNHMVRLYERDETYTFGVYLVGGERHAEPFCAHVNRVIDALRTCLAAAERRADLAESRVRAAEAERDEFRSAGERRTMERDAALNRVVELEEQVAALVGR